MPLTFITFPHTFDSYERYLPVGSLKVTQREKNPIITAREKTLMLTARV